MFLGCSKYQKIIGVADREEHLYVKNIKNDSVSVRFRLAYTVGKK